LGTHTTRGAFWTILFSLLNKVVSFGSQIALAWFLLPKDMGLVAMALSVTSVFGLISGMNLKNMLVQQQEHFARDVGQVFWLSLLMGLTGSFFLAAAAPFAGTVFNDQRVVPLILLISIANFLGSAPTVYAAVLSRDLRFRALATIGLVSGSINNLGAVALAARGFGPYALVLPLTASSAFSLVAARWLAGKILVPRPDPRKWLPLLKPAGLLMLNSMLSAILGYGVNFIIGLQHNATVAGYYFWGFSIASQAVFLLAINLQGVLFPALAKLNAEPGRQLEAFRKACMLLSVAVVPVCTLQVLLAKPALQVVFDERWLPAAGVVEGLSIGLMTQPVAIISSSFLMARGASGTLCWLTGISACLTLIAAAAGGAWGDQTTVAWSVGGAMVIANLVVGWRTLNIFGPAVHQLQAILCVPLGAAAIVLAIGALAKNMIAGVCPLWQCVVITPLVLVVYALLYFSLMPEVRLMIASLVGLELKRKAFSR
jgi:O-antigen/teichoic acid export membrane protein